MNQLTRQMLTSIQQALELREIKLETKGQRIMTKALQETQTSLKQEAQLLLLALSLSLTRTAKALTARLLRPR
jgi:hypothetical protein